ncbi:hypothetical protein DER46DRAFT_380831 [Fusarium sp. MPI-SDFR-AT-0072]|nr:hypothetical protein DER46DRAFT_380831 [Fusarium sp. MPI-SDFR-AT-0072]
MRVKGALHLLAIMCEVRDGTASLFYLILPNIQALPCIAVHLVLRSYFSTASSRFSCSSFFLFALTHVFDALIQNPIVASSQIFNSGPLSVFAKHSSYRVNLYHFLIIGFFKSFSQIQHAGGTSSSETLASLLLSFRLALISQS